MSHPYLILIGKFLIFINYHLEIKIFYKLYTQVHSHFSLKACLIFLFRITILSSSCSLFFVPVQTSFPLLKRRKVAFGSISLYTNPGNCSGSYSVFSISIARKLRLSFRFIVPEATMFWTVIFGFVVILTFIFLSCFITA